MKDFENRLTLAREIVVGWERLRVIYNVVMFLVGGSLLWIVLQSDAATEATAGLAPPIVVYLTAALLFGIGANVCYCVGPYLELMLVALGYPESGKRVRYFLFGIGLLFSVLVMLVPFSMLPFPAPN